MQVLRVRSVGHLHTITLIIVLNIFILPYPVQVLLVGAKAGKNKLEGAMRKGPNIRVMYEEEFWSKYGRE